MLSFLGFLLAFVCLVSLTWKSFNIYVVSLISATILMVFNKLPIMETFSNAYMPAMAGFFQKYFLIFIFGSIIGRMYVESGAGVSIARAIMKRIGKEGSSQTHKNLAVIITVMLTCLLLGFGGVNVVVVPVALYPLFLSLMEEANIPKKHVIGLCLSGLATVTMTAPGTPQIQNIIPQTILHTSPTAGLIPGIIGCIVVVIGNIYYLNWQFNKDIKNGEGFQYGETDVVFDESKGLLNFGLSLVPLALIFILFNGFKVDIVPALVAGTIVSILLFAKPAGYVTGIKKACADGAMFAVIATLNIGALAAFGAVIKSAPAFMDAMNYVASLNGNPLVISTLATAFGAGLTGSASGGITVSLPIVAPIFQGMVNPDALHRCVSMVSSSLDTLPFNGGFLMFLALTGLNHSQAYKTVFMTTVFMTSIGAAVCLTVCLLFPGLV